MKLIDIERDVIHTQAKTCVGLIMVGYTAIYVLPGRRKKDGNLFRLKLWPQR